MSTHSKIPSGLGARRDHTYQEEEHDTNKLRGKLKEPTVCTECGTLFHKGRWTWNPTLAGADEIVCKACLRIRNTYPEGFLTLSGPFLADHKGEIMGYEQQGAALAISTTDTHLPRRIGESPHHAYEGTFDVRFNQDEQFIRVTWTR